MKTKIIFAGLLGLAVMLPLALPAMALASPQDDYEKGEAAYDAQDYPEAVRWYRQAAEQGDASAQTNLGFMYDRGLGVAQNYAEAVRWYRKAAEQGIAKAQSNLGFMYQQGRGVKRDYVQAHKWLNIASALGNKNTKKIAKPGRQLVEIGMTAQQIAEAQKEATKWLEAHKKRRK